MKPDFFDLLALLGLILLSTGFGLINLALGLIAGGFGLLIVAIIGAFVKYKAGGPK